MPYDRRPSVESGFRITLIPGQYALHEMFEVCHVGGRDPAAFQEHVLKWFVGARSDVLADCAELLGIDQSVLKGKHSEKQVAIRVHFN
jgi:uncharacterized Fe-S cluster-containing radical SAM superfamily protein